MLSWLVSRFGPNGERLFVRRYQPNPMTREDANEESKRVDSLDHALHPVKISNMMGRSWRIVTLTGQTILGVADIITVLRLMENINQEVYFEEA